ncbi:MAG: head maturation protease, ClpP-related [Peptococcia bacterium]
MPNNKFWNFKASEGKTGELFLYGEISSSTWFDDDVTPKQFKADLDALGDISELKIYINSGGGDVFAGQAIYSMLKRHGAKKTVYIDGLAASIASVIAMAGDKVIMPANAMLMIHNAWTIAAGSASYFRKLADDMDKIDESIQGVYVAKTGKKAEEIAELMDAETWMSAEDAVNNGFADEIEAEKRIAASMDGDFLMLNGQKFSLERYKNKPKIEEYEPESPQNEPDNGGESQPVADTREHFTALRKKILKAYEEEK